MKAASYLQCYENNVQRRSEDANSQPNSLDHLVTCVLHGWIGSPEKSISQSICTQTLRLPWRMRAPSNSTQYFRRRFERPRAINFCTWPLNDISSLESSALKRPCLALNEWISGQRALVHLAREDWEAKVDAGLPTNSSQRRNFLQAKRSQSYGMTKIQLLHSNELVTGVLPKKKTQSLSQVLSWFSEVKGIGSLESRWACNHISCCSKDFKMAATSRIVARSPVKSIFWSTGAIHFNLFTTRV